MADDSSYASKEDFNQILKAIGESTTAVSNLAVKLEHQSSLIEAAEKRNDKRIDKLELEAKEDRKSSSASRKEMHKEITDLGQRLIPTELMTETITKLSNKIIGTLAVSFIVGGIGVFAIFKAMGASV